MFNDMKLKQIALSLLVVLLLALPASVPAQLTFTTNSGAIPQAQTSDGGLRTP
jgi:predicted S18 family serine protease